MNISCIVPVYNEEKRIGAVLSVLEQCDFLHEIVVVDDCSTDNSGAICNEFKKITLIRHPENKGKSTAINTGITHSQGDVLLFIDADLEGLTVDAIRSLTEPIINNSADMSLSLRKNAPGLWKYIGLDYITGERCFKKEIITDSQHHLPSLAGFELEVFLNNIVIKKNLRLAVVSWLDVVSPLKRKKFGIYLDFLYMGINILQYLTPWGIVYQIWRMKKLTV